MAKFKRGAPRPECAGRKPGSKNRIPLAAKEAVHQALNDGAGAVAYLLKLKHSKVATDRQAFVHLVGKLIPREVVGDFSVTDDAPRVIIYLPDNGRGPETPDEPQPLHRPANSTADDA
jgi:hypothetical protein